MTKIYQFALDNNLTKSEYPRYSNLFVETVTVEDIYKDNLWPLASVRAKYDPDDVMRLCAGQRIPLLN